MYVNMSPTFHPCSSSTVASSTGSIYLAGAKVTVVFALLKFAV